MVKADVVQKVEIIAWLETEHEHQIVLQDLCSIGRETSNNIILDKAAVSRHHAVIHKRDNEFWMVDLGGINGVQVNGIRVIEPVRLQLGDRIQMPTASFTFQKMTVPASVPPEKKRKASETPLTQPELIPAQVDEKNALSQALATEALPLVVRREEQKELPLETEPLPPSLPLPAPPEDKKEPPPEVTIKPQIKIPDDRKKPPSVPKASLPAPKIASADNVCLMAKRSMYIGLASIFLPFVGLLSAAVAVVMGHKALRTIKQSKGALLGQNQAVLGLYFGYITLALILVYTTFFAFYFSSHSSSAVIANTPGLPTFAPIIITPSKQNTQSSSSSAAMASSPTTPSLAPLVTPPDIQKTPEPSTPQVVAKSQAIQTQMLPGEISAINDMASNDHAAQTSAPSSSDASLIDAEEKKVLAAASLENANPVAPDSPPPVFSYAVQTRLKDGMLAQPMPTDGSERTYLDAEAFNNCARILARQPETKYAESVRGFLEDVKARNPDPARLQILTAMYQNYLSALTKPGTSGD